MGAAATQNRQIVAGQKYSSNDASSYNFSRETGFYVKSLIFKCQQLTPKKKKKRCSASERLLGLYCPEQQQCCQRKVCSNSQDGCEDCGSIAWSYQIALITE